MVSYRLAGKDFYFGGPIPELESFMSSKKGGASPEITPVYSFSTAPGHTSGWVAGAQRKVDTWWSPAGLTLRVEGGSDFLISLTGERISRAGTSSAPWTSLDREILLGPALVLALALRGTWCLHASGVVFKKKTFAFLGESGLGKSTLAGHLSAIGGPEWRLLADDILPVSLETAGLTAWPHYPQLKIPMEAQPAANWKEQIRLHKICILTLAEPEAAPQLEPLTGLEAIQTLISHTVGARMFMPELLAAHLDFCARTTRRVPIYRLKYPHRKDALPRVRALLEGL